MSDSLPVLGSMTPKFLLTKEKISRGIFAAIGFGVMIVTGIKVFPYISQFATLGIEAGYKLTVLGIEIAAILAVVGFIIHPTTQAALWSQYMGFIDKFALRLAKVDPVTRVRAYVTHYLQPMKARAEQVLANAVGREKSAKRRLDDTQKLLEEAIGRADYAMSHGRPDGVTWKDSKLRTTFSVQSAKIRTMKDAVKRLEKRLAFQQGCVMVLRDLSNVITAYTEVTDFNVQMMVEEYESADEMAEGGREVRGMLGASEKTKQFNLTAQYMMQETDRMMAEVESVMDMVSKRIDEGKIDDSISEESLIRELTERVGNMSNYAESQRQLAEAKEPTLFVNAKSRVLEEVPVGVKTTTIDIPSSNPSSRFRNILPPSR